MAAVRMKGVSITRQLVTGNIAFYRGEKAEAGKTHQWVCYVRGNLCYARKIY